MVYIKIQKMAFAQSVLISAHHVCLTHNALLALQDMFFKEQLARKIAMRDITINKVFVSNAPLVAVHAQAQLLALTALKVSCCLLRHAHQDAKMDFIFQRVNA